MKNYTVTISDEASGALESRAKALGADGRTYASVVLDNLFSSGASPAQFQWAAIAQSKRTKPATSLNVADVLPGYPPLSIELAQAFVDEALKLPKVKVRQHKRSISFTPPFVFLDYLLSTRAKERGGIVASFYGKAAEFNDPRGILREARRSYLRARIINRDDLAYCLPFIRHAYELRYGKSEVKHAD